MASKSATRAEDDRWARELEETAADYVGRARARAMARSGYFHKQVVRARRAGNVPPWREQKVPPQPLPRGASEIYSQGVADGAAGRPHAPTDHPEYVAGYREGKQLVRR